jgi:hypothetical protein
MADSEQPGRCTRVKLQAAIQLRNLELCCLCALGEHCISSVLHMLYAEHAQPPKVFVAMNAVDSLHGVMLYQVCKYSDTIMHGCCCCQWMFHYSIWHTLPLVSALHKH